MYKIGDIVFLEAGAERDIHPLAWPFLKNEKGTVKSINQKDIGTKNQTVELVLEFPFEFPGGHYCMGVCEPRRGQNVMADQVSLCFEESRETITAPVLAPGVLEAYQKRIDEGKPSVQRM